ncbi:MAG TPA: DNA polymerase I [Stellaceae bacterium]|nr:DNA polymerase I [Stellaceae bacterium]
MDDVVGAGTVAAARPTPPPPAAPSATPHHVFLIDGSGFIFRAYFARARDPKADRFQRKSDGMPTEVVTIFSNMLDKYRRETDADYMAVVFDASGASFRNRIYDQYKANRRETPDDLVPQFEHVRRAAQAFDICQIELADFEADDLIATYARHAAAAGARVTILSSDKDLMQLVGGNVTMRDPMSDRPIGEDEVREKFGVGPDKVIEVQALCGDSTDNVPGVPGIGVKTAAELINAYGDLETLLAHAHEIKQPKRREALIENEAKARLSKVLVTLDDDVPLPCPLSELRVKPYDPAKLFAFLDEMELRALKGRIVQRLAADPSALAASPGEPAEPVIPQIPPFSGERNYQIIDTAESLEKWIRSAQDAGEVALWVAASAVPNTRPELCGISLAHSPSALSAVYDKEHPGTIRAAYIPLGHRTTERQTSFGLEPSQAVMAGLDPAIPENEDVDARNKSGHDEKSNLPRLTIEAALARLKPLLEDPGILKIGHDMKGAAQLLLRYGIALGPCDCTMLMSYVLDGGQVDHAIEELTSRALSHPLTPAKALLGSGRNLVAFAAVATAAACEFAAGRADAALRLHMLLKARLVREHMTAFYETIERPLVPVVAAMEHAGVKVDRAALAELSRDFARRIAELEAAIWRDVGNDFNIGSPKQLGEVLFEKLQLPGGKKGKTGAYGTDAGVLETLAPLHPVPAQVLEWRQLTKLKSTYADALGEEIDSQTGRVHTSFALAATATGRLSSSEPNIQNIPIRTEEGRKIRHAFVAEPGHLLLSADYSQIELRLAAHVADIPALKDAFLAGHDIHAATASEVFGVPLDRMDPQTRRRAKAINFGIIYGISAFGLGNQIGVPQSEAAAYIRAYFERFPGIRGYMERIKAEARRAGYVETIFGRKCFIPGIRDANPARRAGAERQAINAPLQGSAADIIKRAMGRLPAALAAAGLKARMLLQVHDELLFETAEDEVEATARLVKEVMEGACAPRLELSVPLVVETGWAKSWDEAH